MLKIVLIKYVATPPVWRLIRRTACYFKALDLPFKMAHWTSSESARLLGQIARQKVKKWKMVHIKYIASPPIWRLIRRTVCYFKAHAQHFKMTHWTSSEFARLLGQIARQKVKKWKIVLIKYVANPLIWRPIRRTACYFKVLDLLFKTAHWMSSESARLLVQIARQKVKK